MRAQVSIATVSRALRSDPVVNHKTQERVKAVAEQLGYAPDPALSALNAYREEQSTRSFRGTLAWLTAHDSPQAWRQLVSNREMFDSMLRLAPKRGYTLEPFWIHPKRMPAKRLHGILRSRSVRGIFLPSLPAGVDHIDFTWDRYCTVALSESVLSPHVHSVQKSTSFDVRTCVRELAKAGYSRPILAVHSLFHRGCHGLHEGAFLTATQEYMPKSRPVFHTDRHLLPDQLRKWVEKTKADSIICSLSENEAVPNEAGLPPLVSFSGYVEPNETGILHSMDNLAKIALDFLESMLNRGEYGIPENPIVLRVQGKWQAGKLRPKT